MDSEVAATPVKGKAPNFSRVKSERSRSENVNPNLRSPGSRVAALQSPVICKSGNGDSTKRVDSSPGKRRIRQRRFVIAKKKNGERKGEGKERACEAYEKLRAEQEEFFKRQNEEFDFVENLCESSEGSGGLKRGRDKVLEESRNCIPEPGSGRVMHLVQAFEKLRVVPSSDCSEEKKGDKVKHVDEGIEWGFPEMHPVSDDSETRASTTMLSPSDFLLTRESLGLVSSRSSSVDSSQGSISVRTSIGRLRNRASSTESSGTQIRKPWKRNRQRSTSQKPFKLRTENRGRLKEEEHEKKLQKQMEEEEKMRIPIAQGLPWTTDEPERLVKPPTKETTKPINLVLNTDIRAVERAEFDYQIAVKLSTIEQQRMEWEKQQKVEEEEEVRRLRKELVPKAQPMPYFDNPFVPKRSTKQPTIPKDPKFNLPQHKKIKCNASLCGLQPHSD